MYNHAHVRMRNIERVRVGAYRIFGVAKNCDGAYIPFTPQIHMASKRIAKCPTPKTHGLQKGGLTFHSTK